MVQSMDIMLDYMPDPYAIDFNQLASELSTQIPQLSTPNQGMGTKCFVELSIGLDNIKYIIEIYSELVIGYSPKSAAIGYSIDDINRSAGVAISIKNLNIKTKRETMIGCVITFNDFLDKHVTNRHSIIIYNRLLEALEQYTPADDRFFGIANSLWDNRIPGKQKLSIGQYN